jgi:hypothetical protein
MATMREVLLLIGEDDVVLWSDVGDSPVALPDSRARWEAIWSRRDRIVEIAHSHPVGPQAFSREDESTMAALVTALGRSLTFSVIAPNGMVRCNKKNDEAYEVTLVECEPWWASLLRHASSMGRPSTLPPKTPKTPQEE